MYLVIALLSLWISSSSSKPQAELACPNPLPYAALAPGLCASIWTSGISAPRAIATSSNGDIVVLESGTFSVLVFWEDGGQVRRATLAKQNGLNHEVFIHNGYIYASNSTTVFRWRYNPGVRTGLGNSEIVINSMPCCHHMTRSLEFDSSGMLYAQSGSGDNVDPDSTNSRIKRFNIASVPSGGLSWNAGEIFADGLRNEVGIKFDSQGRLWGVENGVDDLNRPDLGGDIHQDNPSEEINMFTRAGGFYGYPYCWSEFKLINNQSHPVGTQWAHPQFMNDGKHTDAWCRDMTNVVPPVYNLPAHTAPLGILFYNGNTFPGVQTGDAIITQHGSWDRNTPSGYRVSLVKIQNGSPVSDSRLLAYSGPGDTGPNWPIRPVGLTMAKCGGKECMLVTSDSNGIIISIFANT